MSLAGSPALPDSSSPADMMIGAIPRRLKMSVDWNVLPWPLPPQMPRMSGTLICGRSMKFFATCTVILSMYDLEM